MRGEPFAVFGDGEQRRAFTYVGDIAPVIASCPDVETARGQAINVGSDTATTINDLARAVAAAMGVGPTIDHLEARNEVVDALPRHDRATEIFGPCVETPLMEGIAAMADWAQSVGPMEPSRFDEIEIDQGLPPSWRA